VPNDIDQHKTVGKKTYFYIIPLRFIYFLGTYLFILSYIQSWDVSYLYRRYCYSFLVKVLLYFVTVMVTNLIVTFIIIFYILNLCVT